MAAWSPSHRCAAIGGQGRIAGCRETVWTMKNKHQSGLIGFFAIAFALSWSCWILAALLDRGFDSSPVRWLTYAGAFGPAAAAIALVYLTGDEQDRADYWARVTEVSRIRGRWMIPVLLLYPLVTALALLCDTALTGVAPALSAVGEHLLSAPSSIVAVVVWLLLLGPIPEELGWRGYALDRLQHRWGALTSSIILGLLWAAWHLPLFFVKGSYQNQLGVGSLSFWSYGLTVIEVSVLLTWIYNNNARSVLAAILFHAVLNISGAPFLPSPVAEVTKALVMAIVVGVVVLTWTPTTLSTFRLRTVGKG